MVYILCSSLWETNLLHLDSAIRRISFHDLRDPKDSTNDELHNQREDLDYLRRFVGETLKWYPGTLTGYFSTLSTYNQASSKELNRDPVSDPIHNLHRILGEAGMLQAFLIDTFQLLISSLSVRESKLSIEQAKLSNAQALLGTEQARRSAWLTQLASIYLPLSVVTGIFGMNLKEISESPPRFWWAVVVLVVLVMCTVAIYWTLKEVKRVVGRRGREQRKGIEVDREA
jgi:Mg2+ and Co2+ transporter CorA